MKNCQSCPIIKDSVFLCKENEIFNDQLMNKKNLRYRKGELLFDSMTNNDGVFCIKTGAIKIMRMDSNGNETTLRIVSAGEIIGWHLLKDISYSKNQAQALMDSEVCYIDSKSFEKITENKTVVKNLLIQTQNALTKAENHIYSCHQKKVLNRLAECLLELNEKTFIHLNSKGKKPLSISREELAMIIGTAPETVIRALSDLRKKGIINKGKQIIICDEVALRNLTQEL